MTRFTWVRIGGICTPKTGSRYVGLAHPQGGSGYVGFSTAKLGLSVWDGTAATRVAVPAPRASKAGGKYADGMIQGPYLMAQTGKKLLYTMADSPAKFAEFKAMWEPVIIKAGMKPVSSEYSAGFGALKYESPDNSAIRSFLCDTAHMPLSEGEMEKTLAAALKAEGLKVVGSFGIPVDPDTFIKPTVSLYYLTAYNENPNHEIQMRYLKINSGAVRLDYGLLERAGVKIAARYGDNSIFYIGKLLGVALAVANSTETVEKQVAYHKKMIKARREKLIDVKTDKLDQPMSNEGVQYSYLTKIYYFK